jgi:Tfp pilus assembly protein PilF
MNLARFIFCSLAALAFLAKPALAQSYELKDCEQEDSASLSLRACTTLLQSSELNNEDRARILARRGFAWLIEDDADDALADFTAAIKLNPRELRALIGRARTHSLLEQHAKAAEGWSAVIALDPNSEAHYLKRGASYLAAQDMTAAMADFDKTVALNPKSIDGFIGRANVFVALKDKDNALTEFARAVAIDPKHSAPYVARAEAAEIWGDTKLAIENYGMALTVNTTVWAARKSLKRLGIDTPP